MSVYATVDNGIVTNIVEWDGDTSLWQPPEGNTAVLVTSATASPSIGYTYNGTSFSAPQ